MDNYLFLKQSSEPVKVGDLTNQGIIKHLPSDDFEYYYIDPSFDEFKGNIYKGYITRKLTPLLITDAPDKEEIYFSNSQSDGNSKKIIIWQKEIIKNYTDSAIPFHSNEQVYNWLKIKGIKPEAEMLIEFDGEIRFAYKCNAGAIACGESDMEDCPFCTKTVVIKEPEVKQEGNKMYYTKNEMEQMYDMGRYAIIHKDVDNTFESSLNKINNTSK